MGIKDLWTILTPFYERKPLFDLQGKTVAVDLSGWVCESQCIAEYSVQPRMYLRNLYFRTCYLLLMDVTPVFVLEGRAPTMKYDKIAQRNAVQFKGARPRAAEAANKPAKDRSRFNHTLQQCREMLGLMGLACVRGEGEAEALCAYLNEDGLVDGCISQDSDCFAYGARIVYRNFSISTQGPAAASGGSVDVYDVRKAETGLGLGRNKIVALALLLGCDYCDGVHGVGKESALKLLNKYSDAEALDVLRSWRSHDTKYAALEERIGGKRCCATCGHAGHAKTHLKVGCADCRTNAGCDSSVFKEEKVVIKNELSVRAKASAVADFPNERLVDEFLKRKDNVLQLDLRWKRPDIKQFMKFTVKYLQWEEIYAFQKFLPVTTRWHLTNVQLDGTMRPKRIKKVRTPKGTPSYEIIWEATDVNVSELIPAEQLKDVDADKLWSTVEPQHVVDDVYPELVQRYKDSKIKPKKASKRQAKEKIDAMPAKPKRAARQKKTIVPATESVHDVSLSAVYDLNQSNFGDESDMNVSDIIDHITSKPIDDYKPEDLPPDEPHADSFFGCIADDGDVFERTFNEMQADTDDDNDDEENDSFSEAYVPLAERLKRNELKKHTYVS